ncbi:MAG TPA: peptidase M61 [Flavobacterium sp.]|nr:peptidase M61 [Flavobacterium sp.]
MKKILVSLLLALSFVSHDVIAQGKNKSLLKVGIDLQAVKDDKVMVAVEVPKVKTEKIIYRIPKTVPGTYSIDNYGKFIDDLKAFDAKGSALAVKKLDENSWEISDAKKLSKITYLVNDTFDNEKGGGGFGDDVFSPAGTNIDEGKNYMINTHGFVGYFNEFMAIPYQVTVTHPSTIWGATSMADTDASGTKDVFMTSRYAELVEHPIMYSKPDYTTFNVNGMEIVIAVYSPTGAYTAESITPEMKKIMTAQKNFLGKFNATKKYCVLLYLSTMAPNDAHGMGALEHPTSTTVVLPEAMPKDQLVEQMKDVVSHEFFHIVTPLAIHSKEIQDFDYNDPKMSEHLWMYEGVTEYFANLFQVNQGLITEEDFYIRMADKIARASRMDDRMPFTKMSANVLAEPYKAQYLNVYQKGALIAMCIDIIIREKSNGERGILDLMQRLSAVYGADKAFDDKDLFAKIIELTYPEVGAFLSKYVAGTTPIPYDEYLAKMGVAKAKTTTPGGMFIGGQTPYITVSRSTKEISVRPGIELNSFYTALGIKNGDALLEINGTKYNLDNIEQLVFESQSWKDGDAIAIKIRRDGKEQTIKGNVKLPYIEKDGFAASDKSKEKLKNAWLKK